MLVGLFGIGEGRYSFVSIDYKDREICIKEGEAYKSIYFASILEPGIRVNRKNKEPGCFERYWGSFNNTIMKPLFGKRDKQAEKDEREEYASFQTSMLKSTIAEPNLKKHIEQPSREESEEPEIVNDSEAKND